MKYGYYKALDDPPGAVAVDLAHGDMGLGITGRASLITRINTPHAHRGLRHAADLMKEVLADADREGVTLALEVAPSDGLDYDKLHAWYERLGFENWDALGNIMIRRPQ